jgi:hypothetical protein
MPIVLIAPWYPYTPTPPTMLTYAFEPFPSMPHATGGTPLAFVVVPHPDWSALAKLSSMVFAESAWADAPPCCASVKAIVVVRPLSAGW